MTFASCECRLPTQQSHLFTWKLRLCHMRFVIMRIVRLHTFRNVPSYICWRTSMQWIIALIVKTDSWRLSTLRMHLAWLFRPTDPAIVCVVCNVIKPTCRFCKAYRDLFVVQVSQNLRLRGSETLQWRDCPQHHSSSRKHSRFHTSKLCFFKGISKDI